MKDVSKFSTEALENSQAMYSYAAMRFCADPMKASGKIQRKMKKSIIKTFDSDSIPEELSPYMGKSAEPSELFALLGECKAELDARKAHELEELKAACKGFDEDTVKAVLQLCEAMTVDIISTGDELKFITDYTSAFRKTFTLYDARISGRAFDPDDSFLYACGVSFDGEKQCLRFSAVNSCDEMTFIEFSKAQMKIDVFNCVESQSFYDNPWTFLNDICSNLMMKYECAPSCCNEAELELMPLMREIKELDSFIIAPFALREDCCKFPLLKSLAQKYGNKKTASMLEQLENDKLKTAQREAVIAKIYAQLNLKKYEPMWRETYERIEASQREYPTGCEVCIEAERLNKSRKEIENRLFSHGYTGEYPCFSKRGKLSGIHLINSYDMSYFVGNERNARYFIRCREIGDSIEMLCGTAFLKKDGDDVKDVYSCTFNAQGKRLLEVAKHCPGGTQEWNELASDPTACADAAVKAAQLEKLSADEKELVYRRCDTSARNAFGRAYLTGGLFSAFMITAAVIFVSIATAIAESPAAVIGTLSELHLGRLFVGVWLVYGTLQGIVDLAARRR